MAIQGADSVGGSRPPSPDFRPFSVFLLTLGADIYTTSKLHTNITTTQIYAMVVDEKKNRAVRLMDGLLGER